MRRIWIYVFFFCYALYLSASAWGNFIKSLQRDQEMIAKEKMARFFTAEVLIWGGFVLEGVFLVCFCELWALSRPSQSCSDIVFFTKGIILGTCICMIIPLYLKWCQLFKMLFGYQEQPFLLAKPRILDLYSDRWVDSSLIMASSDPLDQGPMDSLTGFLLNLSTTFTNISLSSLHQHSKSVAGYLIEHFCTL